MGRPRVALFEVRCLGPGQEHTFLSPDPVNRRICKKCQAWYKTNRFSPIVKATLPDSPERIFRSAGYGGD
jgi:hypothetical protein